MAGVALNPGAPAAPSMGAGGLVATANPVAKLAVATVISFALVLTVDVVTAAVALALELLDRLRLAHLSRANPFTLSGGEQRRLSVATVLATKPPVLVLDEPTFGQDARTWAELVALFGELLDGGAALLAATHDEALVAALGGRTLRLPDPPGALATPPLEVA